jgi:hypothetical protein
MKVASLNLPRHRRTNRNGRVADGSRVLATMRIMIVAGGGGFENGLLSGAYSSHRKLLGRPRLDSTLLVLWRSALAYPAHHLCKGFAAGGLMEARPPTPPECLLLCHSEADSLLFPSPVYHKLPIPAERLARTLGTLSRVPAGS